MQHVAMVLHYSLRLASRAGGVEDVSEPVGFDYGSSDRRWQRIHLIDIDQAFLEFAGRAKRRRYFGFASVIQSGVAASLWHRTPNPAGQSKISAVRQKCRCLRVF